jgi:hypothetical protein
MDEYSVTVWDKSVNEPYLVYKYADVETGKYVARRMNVHYVEEWGEDSPYSVHLKKRERLND